MNLTDEQTPTTTGNVLNQETQPLNVYFKLKSIRTEIDSGTQEFLKSKLDLELPKVCMHPV